MRRMDEVSAAIRGMPFLGSSRICPFENTRPSVLVIWPSTTERMENFSGSEFPMESPVERLISSV